MFWTLISVITVIGVSVSLVFTQTYEAMKFQQFRWLLKLVKKDLLRLTCFWRDCFGISPLKNYNIFLCSIKVKAGNQVTFVMVTLSQSKWLRPCITKVFAIFVTFLTLYHFILMTMFKLMNFSAKCRLTWSVTCQNWYNYARTRSKLQVLRITDVCDQHFMLGEW